MMSKITFLLSIFALVCSDSDILRLIKRSKYYSTPTRIYRLPPPPQVIKGPFSYTPPPMVLNKPKFKRPIDDGLADEDINNLVKHLTKKDLDKIVEYASENERYAAKCYGRCDNDGRNVIEPPYRRPERTAIYRSELDERPSWNGPFNNDDKRYVDNTNYVTQRPSNMDHNYNLNFANDIKSNILQTNRPDKIEYFNAEDVLFSNQPVEVFKSRVVYSNGPTEQIPSNNNIPYSGTNNIDNYAHFPVQGEESRFNRITQIDPNSNVMYTNSSIVKEEQLPRPINLRDDDEYLISYTNNVPTVVKSNMYKVESFKDVPLMNYVNSKLHSVSSYNVPHYTVTSTKSRQSTESSTKIPTQRQPSIAIDHSPGVEITKAESEAHLKAVRIWTHHSSGTAYTLHDDGTLSVEKPRSSF